MTLTAEIAAPVARPWPAVDRIEQVVRVLIEEIGRAHV